MNRCSIGPRLMLSKYLSLNFMRVMLMLYLLTGICFAQFTFSNVVMTGVSSVGGGGSTPVTYLLSEDWEGSNLGSWAISQTESAVNWDNTTNVLEGSESLAVVAVDNANYAYNIPSFEATDDCYAFFLFKLAAGPSLDDYTRSAMWLKTTSSPNCNR
jgi:hypothetical protein